MQTIEEMIYEETEMRLNEMRKDDYIFPEKADKKDAIAIIVSIAICSVLIILCMIGVIK